MKLVHYELENTLICGSAFCTEWIIESPMLFSKYVQELYSQCQGKEGKFVLSDQNKILDIAKSVEMILNPFAIDINDKKIINKLYSQLNEVAIDGDNYLSTQEIMQVIYKYISELEQKTEHILLMEKQIDLPLLFKAAGVKHEVFEEDFVHTISRYIRVVCDVLKVKVIIFVNLRSYLSDIQLEEILMEANYQEVKILMIESHEKSCLEGVRRYIIDSDQCEIF